MKRSRAAAGLAGAAALALAACGPPRPQRHEIDIRAFVFVPDTVAVRPGDTLVVVNHDAVPHTATADGKAWDTGEIPANGTRSVVVPASGAGPYHCVFHPTMKGLLAAR